MKGNFLILCFILFFAFGCTKQDEKTIVIDHFEQTDTLTATVLPVSPPLLLPRYMGITGEKLFVYKEREERLFQFFSLPDGQCIGTAGTKGQGPDEWAGILDARSFCTTDTTFSVLEAGTNRYKTVVWRDSTLHIVGSKQLLPPGRMNNGLYPMGDGRWVTVGDLVSKAEYTLLDEATDKFTPMDDYPEWDRTESDEEGFGPFMKYIKNCVVSPDHKRIAAFYSYFKRLRIYDRDLQQLHDVDIQTPPLYPVSSQAERVSEAAYYYVGTPQAVGSYIYALCANAERSGYQARRQTEIHVFDWHGRPVACWTLDRPVSLFAVSSRYKKIYALDGSRENELYVYPFPEDWKINP